MPADRDPKRDAEDAHAFFIRLEAKGHSRQECAELTAAWIMARRAEVSDEEAPEEPWRK